MTPLSLLVAAVATLNYAAAKNCADLINSCEGYNSGGECNDGGVEVHLPAQNPDYVIQAFRYYGIPIIDTAVWLIAVILLIIHTKNKAHKTALGGIMCILSLIMSLIGKSVVFSVAQLFGLFLEYFPLFGIYAFGTKGSTVALASCTLPATAPLLQCSMLLLCRTAAHSHAFCLFLAYRRTRARLHVDWSHPGCH